MPDSFVGSTTNGSFVADTGESDGDGDDGPNPFPRGGPSPSPSPPSSSKSGSRHSAQSGNSTSSDTTRQSTGAAAAAAAQHKTNSKTGISLPMTPDGSLSNPKGINTGLPSVIYHQLGYIIATGEPIASGGFGQIYKCHHRERPAEILAAKVIHINDTNRVWADNCLKAEIRIHRELSNHCDQIVRQFRFLKTKNWGFIFMELARGGSVSGYIKSRLKPGELVRPDRVKSWMIQLTTGLQFMHSRGYAHRDIKLDNFLLRSDDIVLLSDFGLSVQCYSLPEGGSSVDSPRTASETSAVHPKWRYTLCGTERYQAPEVASPPYDGQAADIYAMGVALFELTNGRPPYGRKSDTGNPAGPGGGPGGPGGGPGGGSTDGGDLLLPVRIRIARKLRMEYKLSPAFRAGDKCRQLIDWMLQGDWQKRPAASEVLKHPWLTEH